MAGHSKSENQKRFWITWDEDFEWRLKEASSGMHKDQKDFLREAADKHIASFFATKYGGQGNESDSENQK